VDQRLVLTRAHVVVQALGVPDNTPVLATYLIRPGLAGEIGLFR
jgi:hypothetical protein